jgi:monoamine oxidase
MQHNTIIIVGGGLSGLTLAYLLQEKGHQPIVLEASGRFGGRIQTQKGVLSTPLELGATWCSDTHKALLNLLKALNLDIFPQHTKGVSLFETSTAKPPQEFRVPESEAPSYRLKGGTESIIHRLLDHIPQTQLHLNTQVNSIDTHGDTVAIQTADGRQFSGQKVVLCMPPQLISSSINFSPPLPNTLISLMPDVQTWMAGSIKFTLEYKEPFWRAKGFSGMLFSHVGIISEMYDHTNYEEDKFGFTGFLNPGAAAYTQAERKAYVLKQLEQLLGQEAANPHAYYDKIWTDSFVLGNNKLIPRAHFNNGHPLLQVPYYEGKVWFAGTETDSRFPGYMEGAVQSALRVFKGLDNFLIQEN